MNLIGNTRIKMNETFIRFEKKSEKMGLIINENKTKYMCTCRNNRNRDKIRQSIIINDYKFKRVKSFKYLGITITEDNNGSQEINIRTQTGNKCLYSHQDLIQSKLLISLTKVNLYKVSQREVDSLVYLEK